MHETLFFLKWCYLRFQRLNKLFVVNMALLFPYFLFLLLCGYIPEKLDDPLPFTHFIGRTNF